MKNLTEQELKKVQEYLDWLKSGGDVLEFKEGSYSKRIMWYGVTKLYGSNSLIEFTIWNETRSCGDDAVRGVMGVDLNNVSQDNVQCTQDHNCDDYDHLDYFKPIAESLYRNWMFKKICGGILETP